MRLFLAAIAIATLPAQAFFRAGDFKPVAPADVAIGHVYTCEISIAFAETRPDLVTITYTDNPSCTAAEALAARYFLTAAYCSYGDGSGADNARCVLRPAPAAAADPGFFSKAGGSCEVHVFFDSTRPEGAEIHWPGGCARAPVLLAVRYAVSAVLCARTTHCITGPASADPEPDPKVYAPRPSSGPKVLKGMR